MKKLRQLRLIRSIYLPPPAHQIDRSLTALQIDVAVNAPEAGTIKEFLANEEDTVTVGQDLVKLELGGPKEGGGKKEASSEPKEAASGDQSTSSDPEPPRKDDSKPAPPPEEKKPSTPAQEQSKKETPPKQTEAPKSESKSSSSATTLGSREERRVRLYSYPELAYAAADKILGQNEPHASPNCRASEAVAKYCRLSHNLQ